MQHPTPLGALCGRAALISLLTAQGGHRHLGDT